MRMILGIFFFFTCAGSSCRKSSMDIIPQINMTAAKKYTYLALGDSYTIGQSVVASENYPNQTVAVLKTDTLDFQPARIIATTGWTTDELEAGIAAAANNGTLLPGYDFVSLLIGVNDQYRGRTVESYKPAFEELLKKAIHFAGDRADHVVVLSIPDWSVTPFANGMDRDKISGEIDAYNLANKLISQQYNVEYIDITPWTREAATDHSLLAGDGLHPSGYEYKRWADKIAAFFKSKI